MKDKLFIFAFSALLLVSCSEKTEYESTVSEIKTETTTTTKAETMTTTETETTTTTETETTTTTEAETTTTTEAINTYEDVIIDEADKDWFECYNDIITSSEFCYSRHGAELIYFDDDEIPELLTFLGLSAEIYKFDAESKSAEIFADTDIDDLIPICGIYYRPKKNMFSTTLKTGGERIIAVYKYNSFSKDDYTRYGFSEARYVFQDYEDSRYTDFDYAEELNITLPTNSNYYTLFYGKEWKRIELENQTSFNTTNENKNYAMKAMYKTFKEQDIS